MPQFSPPAALSSPLLDPKACRKLGIVAADLLDEALGVLAADEHIEFDTEREVRRESVIDDRVNDHDDPA